MSLSSGLLRKLPALVIVVCVSAMAGSARVDAQQTAKLGVPLLPPASHFSAAFLGMYRKLMEIDDAIDRFSQKYGVDPVLARAVCMFESGGNPDVTSAAGAHGYFQVMPSTFRSMRVPSNVEAGIKYLSQLIKQFGREDYALAAYNGGPGRVARGRAMPLESLQYVIGVGHYRSVLKLYGHAVGAHASTLALVTSRKGDDWAALSQRLDVPALVLKLYNPFVTETRLRRGTFRIAYPMHPVTDLFQIADDGRRRYRSRIGDNYINLAFALDVDVDRLRDANGLWRLQALPADMMLTIPSEPTNSAAIVRALPREADATANAGIERVSTASMGLANAPRTPILHRVRPGETLTEIAHRYSTTVRTIQRVNGLGRRTMIRVGERLRIPPE